MNHTYSSLIPTDPSSICLRESPRNFDSHYTIYSPHSTTYPEYSASKLEPFDYNYWPTTTTTTTTTHNILNNSSNTISDQIPNSSSTIEGFLPTESVNFTNLNSTTILPTHHQHLYPPLSSSPTCNDSSTWLGSSDYQSSNTTGNTSSYGHYSSPSYSFYTTNHIYDPPQPQWVSPQPPQPPPPLLPPLNLPMKFDSSHSSSPSCFELSDGQDQLTQSDPSNSISPIRRYKAPSTSTTSSSSQLISIAPRNPLNGKTRTRDKYRVVYTEQQRHELENEFLTSKYISIPRKAALSLTLALSERQIKIWFQNRRAKERKLHKKRQEISSHRHLNNSHDGDSPSDGDFESPNYYPNYT